MEVVGEGGKAAPYFSKAPTAGKRAQTEVHVSILPEARKTRVTFFTGGRL